MSKLKTERLRAIAAVLEKVAIFVAMALLTYALIVVDTRAATPSVPPTMATSCNAFVAGSSSCLGSTRDEGFPEYVTLQRVADWWRVSLSALRAAAWKSEQPNRNE